MSGVRAGWMLVRARARRAPGRWLATVAGIALATAFAGAVVTEATITADRASRAVLSRLSELDRTIRITYSGVVTPSVEGHAVGVLRQLGMAQSTEVLLLNPVRLDGTLVRPAAISPLGRWIYTFGGRFLPGPCRPVACPMLLGSGDIRAKALTTIGARVAVVGHARLLSAAPLGFAVGGPPLLLSGDVRGLEALPGLSGIYRTRSWLGLLSADRIRSWQLPALERALGQTQATLIASDSGFTLTGPFAALATARQQADIVPERLLLAGGGALAALALFVVLAAGALREDLGRELGRLRAMGARVGQCAMFVALEAGSLSAVAVIVGAGLSVGVAWVLATSAGEPLGAVLRHSLMTGTGFELLGGVWVAATGLITLLVLTAGGRLLDLAAVGAAAGLIFALARGTSGGSGDPLPALLAPLCCLAAGVLVLRCTGALLRGSERVARRGPLPVRLAFMGLARAPASAGLSVAFIALTVGLGGFALAYRATLLRGSADQAAQQVPVDAIIAAGSDFSTPLQAAPLARWRALVDGAVMPVRRTDASYVDGADSVTVPALGVPASLLPQLHGWRSGDASAPLRQLAERLSDGGGWRTPTVSVPERASAISMSATSSSITLTLTALFRDASDGVRTLALGQAGPHPSDRRVTLPRWARSGAWQLQALELDEPTGLAITIGHQNAENPAAATQFTSDVRMGELALLDASGRVLARIPVPKWRGVGAVSLSGSARRFAAAGESGLLRPPAASDRRPLPVVVDPQTGAAAGRAGLLQVTIDGFPVRAIVVGVLRRLPTVPSGAAGFMLADEQALSAALDAQLPGQGRPDELWIATARTDKLRAILRTPRFAQFSASFRGDVAGNLRGAPLARSLLGTLGAASAMFAALAIAGLIVAVLGAGRDRRIEADLLEQGAGPSLVRMELRLRLLVAAVLGTLIGLAIAFLLARLAVASVRAAGAVTSPQPPLVAVAPWGELLLWSLAVLAALWVAAAIVSQRVRVR